MARRARGPKSARALGIHAAHANASLAVFPWLRPPLTQRPWPAHRISRRGLEASDLMVASASKAHRTYNGRGWAMVCDGGPAQASASLPQPGRKLWKRAVVYTHCDSPAARVN